MTSRDRTGHTGSDPGSVESWLVSAGRDRRPGSPLNVPPCPASNLVLGERRAYSRDDGTPGWEAFEEIVGGVEGGSSVSFASGMAGIAAIWLSAQFQQHVVTLYNSFTTTAAPSQPSADSTSTNGGGVIISGGTGACVQASFWEIGARGDTGPSNHGAGVALAPQYSVLSDITDYNGAVLHNTGANPTVRSQYCNGARIPPEFKASGWQVPPGISDATVPNPVFSLQPAATVDEGNNWINLSWGPLALTNPVTGTTLGDYTLAPGSPAIDYIPSTASTYTASPSTDYFGNPRKTAGNLCVDAGAVDVAGTGACAGSGGGNPPPFPTLPVLDNFNRSNTNNLGASWTQQLILGSAALRVNTNQALCNALCAAAPAEWTAAFGSRQAAAFTFANAPAGTETLLLKVSGANLLGLRQNAIEVQYSGSTVTVSTFINFSTSTIGSVAGSFASGDTMTAMADQNGVVYIWKTSGATTTFLGSVTLPSNALWSAGGQIGMLLSSNGSRVDNFAGANVP